VHRAWLHDALDLRRVSVRTRLRKLKPFAATSLKGVVPASNSEDRLRALRRRRGSQRASAARPPDEPPRAPGGAALHGPLGHLQRGRDLPVAVAGDLQRKRRAIARRKCCDQSECGSRLGAQLAGFRGAVVQLLAVSLTSGRSRGARRTPRRRRSATRRCMFVRAGCRAMSSSQAKPEASSMISCRAVTSRA
jgi:hypothetical protein